MRRTSATVLNSASWRAAQSIAKLAVLVRPDIQSTAAVSTV
jgi:hypothetical protein